MALVTLRELRRRSRARADMLLFGDVNGGTEPFYNQSFITNEEINEYINIFAKEYYNLMTQADGEDYFTKVYEPTPSSTVSLPSDFYKLKMVKIGNAPVERASKQEYARNKEVAPVSNIKIVYCPLLKTLVDTVTDTNTQQATIDGINGYEEYIVLRTAIALKTKEESDAGSLMEEFKLVASNMEEFKEDRDQWKADIIQDVRSDFCHNYDFEQQTTSIKYRITGGDMVFVRSSGYGEY